MSIDVGLRSFSLVVLQMSDDGSDADLVSINTWDLKGKDLLEVVKNLQTALDSVDPLVWPMAEVVVEKQVGKFSFAQLEAATYMYAMHKKPLKITSINPRDKLKIDLGGQITKQLAKKYDQNKHYALVQFEAFCAKQTVKGAAIPSFAAARKKDVSDCVLQAFAAVRNSQPQTPSQTAIHTTI